MVSSIAVIDVYLLYFAGNPPPCNPRSRISTESGTKSGLSLILWLIKYLPFIHNCAFLDFLQIVCSTHILSTSRQIREQTFAGAF